MHAFDMHGPPRRQCKRERESKTLVARTACWIAGTARYQIRYGSSTQQAGRHGTRSKLLSIDRRGGRGPRASTRYCLPRDLANEGRGDMLRPSWFSVLDRQQVVDP
jgi:hypothetical protein